MINRLKNIFLICVLFSACTVPQKYQKNKPFVFKNDIEIKGGLFSKDERTTLKQKMFTLINDSVKPVLKDYFFVFHDIKSPAVYDSFYAVASGRNMRNALLHLGYYQAKDSFKADTVHKNAFVIRKWLPRIEKQHRVYLTYSLQAGNPTLIDTFSYKLRIPELQELAIKSKERSFIKQDKPVTRGDVLGEINRLVELFRNNGYYRLTPDDLRMRGDTTIAALTNVDDPFETLRLLEEASRKRDSPTIKLALVINPASDTNKLKKYFINNIYIFPDYAGDDTVDQHKYILDTVIRKQDSLGLYPYYFRYHSKIVKSKFIFNHLLFKKGDLYNQEDYNKTVNNFSRTGVWQNVNVQMVDRKDSTGKLDMYIQLAPAKKYGFEGKIEASYSTNSNTNSINVVSPGNLLGLSGNVSLQSRNAFRQGIKITHSLRTGIEFNLNARPNSDNFINSSDVGYNFTVALPKLLIPTNIRDYINRKDKKRIDKLFSKQSFASVSAAVTNRIGLFKLNSFGLAAGYEWSPSPNQTWSLKILNVEFSDLYNRSRAFDSTLNENPFLRYSFNTALVVGTTIGYSRVNSYSRNRVLVLKANLEQSGWFLSILPLKDFGSINKDLSNFIKGDIEATFTKRKVKSEIAARGFLGVGAPVGSTDTTLPFFKQYFGGGPNSMRGWPIRGIGPGSKLLPAYGVRRLSDRTGDIRFELNAEYRRDLFQMIPNTLTLKWALFADIGNVWNFKNTQPNGGYDSAQFRFSNFYHDLGVNVGTGFRFDFNYVTLRFDFGFRVKRPELSENGGWKLPSIGFDDLWGKLFQKGPDDAYRKWRYENFNFTIGLNYPF